MANVSLDELFPLLAPHTPGAPYATLRFHLAAAAADFCAATHLWRESLFEETTTAGVQDYPLFGTAIVESVLWLVLEGEPLAASDPRLLDKRRLTDTGRPQRYWVRNDRDLMLHPIPDGAYTYSGEIALKPARTATQIPDWLYETWADALVDGALWRVLSIPGKHWSDLQLAALHKQRFDRAKANALTRDLRQVDLRVVPVTF